MSRSRALALAVLATASLVLTACGGGSASQQAQGGSSTSAAPSSSEASPAESSASATPSGSPSEDSSSPEPAAGGGATDFCGAFTELDKLPDEATEADAVAAFRGAAADMRKYAPAEIADSVEKYAAAIEALAQTLETKDVGTSGVGDALQTLLAENAKDIGTVAVYVGKNC